METHPSDLLNSVIGLHTADRVNVDEYIEIGKQQIAEFESGWAKSFNQTRPKKVTTMFSTKLTSRSMASLSTILR